MKKNPLDKAIKFFIILIGILALFSLFFNIKNLFQPKVIKNIDIKDNLSSSDIESLSDELNLELETEKIPEDISISITAIGDIMCHNTQFKDAYRNNVYDFSYVFEDVKEYIESSDIAIGNLETTLAGKSKPYGGYPNFNTPEELAYNLKDLGIDVLSTANNHSLDTGYLGIENTLNFLDDAGISHTGTSRSSQEQNTILLKEVNGIKIAFLSFSYGTNGNPIPKDKPYAINLIDTELILNQLALAKFENPDLICVNMHWGEEYQLVQNSSQEELANFLFENGVDIILGSHPHVLQPFEKRNITLEDGTEKEVFVIYSLGNFMSGQTQNNTRNSIILNLKLTKHGDTNKFTFDEISYIPIYTYTNPNYKNYKVLDIRKAIYTYEAEMENSISSNYYTLLKTELEKIDNTFGEEQKWAH